MMLESSDVFGTKSTCYSYTLGQEFGNAFVLKGRCGNE